MVVIIISINIIDTIAITTVSIVDYFNILFVNFNYMDFLNIAIILGVSFMQSLSRYLYIK